MEEVRLGSRTLQPHRQLLADGEHIQLGKRALDIVSVLAEAKGEIVTKDELLEAVWPGVTVEENALQVHIVTLRKALGPDAERLKTIRGVGYQLALDNAPVAVEPRNVDLLPPTRQTDPALRTRSLPITALSLRRLLGERRWLAVLTVATLGLILLAGWWIAGPQLGIAPQEKIPIVVRQLTPSGSGDPTEAALANGITDELIVRLRRVPELRTATAQADGSAPGSHFRKAYVVDGSIRLSGDDLRVTARLTNASGEIMWAQTFDRRFSELFSIQEEIGAAISNVLSVSFDVGADSTQFGGTDNPEAYAAYLGYLAHQLNPDPSVALGYLDRALVLDSGYGKALVARASIFGFQTARARSREQALALLAEWGKQTAQVVSNRPDMPMGHSARSNYLAVSHDILAADRSSRRASELDKGLDPELRGYLAQWAFTTGRTRTGISLLKSRELIDPIYRDDPRYMLAHLMTGRPEESIALYNRLAGASTDRIGRLSEYPFWAHLMLGDEEAAMAFARQHDVSAARSIRSFREDAALPSMSPEELRRWASQQYGGVGHVELANTALAAGYYGHSQLAAELMRLALDRPGGYALHLLWTPMMAEARKTDAFEQLVTELGFVQAWRESGDWGDFCRPLSANEIACA